MARTVLMPTARMRVLLPDMLEPLMRRARVSPAMPMSLRTHLAAGMRGWPRASASKEGGARYDEFGEGIGGVLEVIGGEGEEGFGFADGVEPVGYGVAVGGAP